MKKEKSKVDGRHKAGYEIQLHDGRKIKCKRVTDIVSHFENKDWLAGWHLSECKKKMIEELNGDGIVKCFNSSIVDGKIDEQGAQFIIDKLLDMHDIALGEASRKSEEAKEVGGLVHKLIERHVDGEKINLDNLSAEVSTAFTNFLKWEKENVKEWVRNEVVVWNEIPKTKGWGVAGRFDAIVILKDGRRCIVDFKASKERDDKYYQSFREQLAFYYWLCDCCRASGCDSYLVKMEKTQKQFHVHDDEIDCAMIVRLDKYKNNFFEVVEMKKGDLCRLKALCKKMAGLFFDRIIVKTAVNQKKAAKKSDAKKAEAVA